MPQAYGRDRVKALDGGRFRIESPSPKGWRAGRRATLTTAEFPGTAIVWDGTLWEVLSCEEHVGASSRYVLAPWRDHHAIRVSADYDPASEQALESSIRRAETRARMSSGIFVAGLFAGLLPAHVQLEVESEYGFVATRLTLLSLFTQFAVAAVGFAGIPIEGLAGPRWPVSLFLLGWLALIEMLIRSWYTLTRSQPLGSIEGLLFWWLACAVTPRARAFDRIAIRERQRQTATASVRPPGDFERERDAFALREPFLALLPPMAQERLAATFGFDPYAWGMRSAAAIAVVSAVGAASALLKIADNVSTSDTWISLALATLLFGEQAKRFLAIRKGRPAGSVFGAFVSPFCKELLAMEPRALEKGTTNKLERALPEVWDYDAPSSDSDHTGR
ncbi:MAG: hypothetical protein HYU52_10745 [Acidobacteria bacterium]|nr:hypothetical protein [Acidobacteriota bacterium]